ncbi:hypothetical protein CBR_g50645 [Chara braunii]|uniref:Protein kinase domain-containing protein n=1 Tax=Chara braunii TaxID=69332 RepID=A0A388M729_CHABU|nr:hypothetical protein CBR_g50645 [Chara braunii]|eukprot:GBG90397.1 hypothetical protein CBR_g50645 [Chara braunii]
MERARSTTRRCHRLGTGMTRWRGGGTLLLLQLLFVCCPRGRASNAAHPPDCCRGLEHVAYRSRSLKEWSPQAASGSGHNSTTGDGMESGDNSTDDSLGFSLPTYGPQPNSTILPPEASASVPGVHSSDLVPPPESSVSPEQEARSFDFSPPASSSAAAAGEPSSPLPPPGGAAKPRLRGSLSPSPPPRVTSVAPSSWRPWCTSIVREMVVTSDGRDLYYVVDDRCESGNQTDRVLLSIREAGTSLMRTGAVSQLNERLVVSHWWPASMGNGSKFESPISITMGGNASVEPMSYVTGMTLSPSGTHLVVITVKTGGDDVQPTMTSLSIRSGYRSSVPIPVRRPTGLALDRSTKPPQLFIADSTRSGLRIASISVDDIGLPLGAQDKWRVLDSTGGGNESRVQTGALGSQSIVADGSCLYFVNKDNNNNRVMGLDLRSSAGHVTLVAGSGRDGISGQDFSFGDLRQLVTTSDGCDLFVTEFQNNIGFIRWIKLRSPCGPAVSVESPFGYPGKTLVGLALEDHDDESLRLHVGANDGLVFSSSIPKSTLQRCSSRDRSRNRLLAIVLPVVLAAVVVTFAAAFLFWKRGRRLLAEQPLLGSSSGTPGSSCGHGGDLRPCVLKRYSIATLSHYTSGFSEACRVGEAGAFGAVYSGVIDGLDVGIKVMAGKLTAEKRVQFAAEVNTLSRLHHANLIQLIGYCDEGDRCVLVYPYYGGGSLDGRLHNLQRAVKGKPPVAPLTLEERVSIGIQIAKALSYLHDGATPPVLHRDIKSSNVLLGAGEGKNIHAVLADFGLATLGELVLDSTHEQFVLTSHIAGTFGYMAPEYMLRGELSEKNDVYAFGVLVLELLTGRRAVWKSPTGVGWQTLVEWARPFLDDERRRDPDINLPDAILDPRLQDQAAGASAARAAMVTDILLLAWRCVSQEFEERPRMGVVLQRLQTIASGWPGGF